MLRRAREGPGGLQQRLEERAVAIEEDETVSIARLLEATGEHRTQEPEHVEGAAPGLDPPAADVQLDNAIGLEVGARGQRPLFGHGAGRVARGGLQGLEP